MIGKLALRSILAEKKRSVCTVLAMVLTAVLFSVLFTTIFGMNQASTAYNIKQAGTKFHFLIKPWNMDNVKLTKKIEDDDAVKSVGESKFLGYVGDKKLNYNVEVKYEDSAFVEGCFHSPDIGKLPEAENEALVDTTTLRRLGVPLKIGSRFKAKVSVGDKNEIKKFVLSGMCSMNKTFKVKVGVIVVSEKYASLWKQKYSAQGIYGKEELGVVLKDAGDIEKNAQRLLIRLGAKEYIKNIGVNPGYENHADTYSNPATIIVGLLLIMLIGYLIINNIFYIAARKDAGQYGQLKTLGMDSRQVATLVRCQALYLLAFAIPIGSVSGLITGRLALPAIIALTNFDAVAGDDLIGSGDVLSVLALTIVFITITTFISILGPVRMIKKLSPIESSKVELKNKKERREAGDGSKVYKFALYNVTRNRKSMLLLIVSITLPLLLVSISYNLSNSFDMNKYLSSKMFSDYTMATASYYRGDYFSDKNNEEKEMNLNPGIVDEIKSTGAVSAGGCVYGTCDASHKQRLKGADPGYWLNIYGIEGFNLQKKQWLEDKMDMNAFKSGTGVIEGCWKDQNGDASPGSYVYAVGDKVRLKDKSGKERSFTVVGHIDVGKGVLTSGISGRDTTYELYFPPNIYRKLAGNKNIMSYNFNVKHGQEKIIERYLKTLVSTNYDFNFQSKMKLGMEFESLRQLIELICVFLCVVLSFIAIMNLINVFVTSIIVREKEIATLRSIGMTRKQLRTMLTWEISYYIISAFILSTILSFILSGTVVAGICNDTSFMTYNTGVVIFALILIVSFAIGYITMRLEERSVSKMSITERIKAL